MINTAHQRFGGAVQVALSFINECKTFAEFDFVVILGDGLKDLVIIEEFPANFEFERVEFGQINILKSLVINRHMKLLEARYVPDVIISTTGPTYFNSKAPQIVGFNLGLYLYPESPYVKSFSRMKKLKFSLKKRLHYYFFKRDTTAFLTQTLDVNQRVQKEFGTEKVYTVTNTASSYYNEPEFFVNRLDPKPETLYRFVTISAFYPHKNLDLIAQVARVLEERGRQNFEFVLTISPTQFNQIFQRKRHIVNVGPISPRECPSLYRECDAMFLPTLAECFSASYPEAMIMGKPIVTTDLGFARSICGEAALYFSAKNAEAAADQIEKLLDDRELQAELVKQGYKELEKFDSPQERAKKYIELCALIADA